MTVFRGILASLIALSFMAGTAQAQERISNSSGGSWFLNYDWMDKVVNRTQAPYGACPTLKVDKYDDGFKVAQETSFYGSISATKSRWFPKDSLWAAVGVGPTKNSFGVIFSTVENAAQLKKEKEKRLPTTAEELAKWKSDDSAYWESQGGLSFYVGAGVDPVYLGVMAVATGGWTNYLEKTGPNKVYVERAKKSIKSVSFGGGVSFPNFSIDKVVESATGYSYEFDLEKPEVVEAFERFMAGDITKAQELSSTENLGVNKIADSREIKKTLARGWGFGLPFIPLISFKSQTQHAYDHFEEESVWGERLVKDYGVYVKQRRTRVLGAHKQVSRSFEGGRIVRDLPGENPEDRVLTEQLYGTLKYSFQADSGGERRLRSYVRKLQGLTGLTAETCVEIPSVKGSLEYNQVLAEVTLSDYMVRELIGVGQGGSKLLAAVENQALVFQKQIRESDLCNIDYEDRNDGKDDTCRGTSPASVKKVFSNLKAYAAQMKKSYANDRTQFSKSFAKFGEEIWKSPFVFKAFFEKGKTCGMEFKYEVSGQRITRHVVNRGWIANEQCLN